MSNWMTSGSARLKAKQNSSFSRRARQRAAVIAPEAVILQERVPASRLPRKKLRQNEAKKRYSSGNPIARRGVVVSIGSANIGDQRLTLDQLESDCPSDVMVSTNFLECCAQINRQPIPQRKRIRDAGARYRRLYSGPVRNIGQNLQSKDVCNSNQRTPPRGHQTSIAIQYVGQNYSHHNINTMQGIQNDNSAQDTSNNLLMPHFPAHTADGIYSNNPVQEASDQLVTRKFSGNGIMSPKHISQSSSIENCRVDNFFTHRQLQMDWEHRPEMDESLTSHPCQALFSQERKPKCIGFKRFQNPAIDDKDIFLHSERGDTGFLRHDSEIIGYNGLDDFNVSNNEISDSQRSVEGKGIPLYQRPESKLDFLEATEANNMCVWNDEYDNAISEERKLTSKLKLDTVASQNHLARRMSDTTNELISLRGPSLRSHGDVGIRRFKRRRKKISYEESYESSSQRQIQPREMPLGRGTRTFSDSHDHQLKSSPRALRFFNDENEVDIIGTPLSALKATERELMFDTNEIEHRKKLSVRMETKGHRSVQATNTDGNKLIKHRCNSHHHLRPIQIT